MLSTQSVPCSIFCKLTKTDSLMRVGRKWDSRRKSTMFKLINQKNFLANSLFVLVHISLVILRKFHPFCIYLLRNPGCPLPWENLGAWENLGFGVFRPKSWENLGFAVFWPKNLGKPGILRFSPFF